MHMHTAKSLTMATVEQHRETTWQSQALTVRKYRVTAEALNPRQVRIEEDRKC